MLAIVAALITLGSLYPLQFTLPDSHTAAWLNLVGQRQLWTSKGDVLGNIALFVPFGFAGVLVAAARTRPAKHTISILSMGFALAAVLQIAQIYVPARSAALADVFWNMIGTGIGILGGILLGGHPRITSSRWREGATLPAMLIALWLGAELLPFVPSLDMQLLKGSLRALLHPAFEIDQIFFHAAGTLVAGYALATIVGEAKSLRWLPMLAGAVAVGKTFIVTSTLDASTLSGLALGCALWWVIAGRRESARIAVILPLLFTAYAVGALMPFALRSTPAAFEFVPFAGLLSGSMLLNSKALAGSLCLYAGLLGVMRMNGASPVPCSVALAVLVTLFELIQTYLVGRNPDVTEPLLVLLAGQLVRLAPVAAPMQHRAVGSAGSIGQTPRGTPSPRPVLPITQQMDHDPFAAQGSLLPPISGFPALRWSLQLAGVCLIMALAFAVILRLPGVPYNVAELFLGNGAFPFLLLFALALLWIGAGARLIGHYVATSTHPAITLPLLALAAGVISLLLLCASVTQESVGDIAGSNNLHWFVVNKEIWGAWAKQAFLHIPATVIAFFERPIRYAALYGPLVTFPALMFALLSMREQQRITVRRLAGLAVSAVLWLWLCKAIAFDWSSTDNLNELIARDGLWGTGGGGYLYVLLAAICANAVLLARVPGRTTSVIAAAAVTAILVPAGWWLLNQGLEPRVHKYSQIFSGAQFLLGPDRKHLLSEQMLFLRWSAVQVGGVMVIAAGARLMQPVIDWRFRHFAHEPRATGQGARYQAQRDSS